MNKGPKGTLKDAEIVQRRDEAIKRALRTPPTHLKDIPKKRQPRADASSGKKP